MTMSLAQLPIEILRIIVAELTFEHDSFIVPFAQTYNRSIYAACSEVLEYRRSIPASKRAICDAFPREKYRPGWSRVDRWEYLNLSYMKMNGTLDWLDERVCELHADEDFINSMYWGNAFNFGVDDSGGPFPAVLKGCPRISSILDDLILQTEAVDCQLPYAFIKLFQRYYYYQPLLHLHDMGYHERLRPYLHKVHPQEGVIGYMVDFFYDRHLGKGMLSLYLSPGPTKGHALVQSRDYHDRWTGDKKYTTPFTIKDAHGTIHEACHHPDDPKMTFFSFDFETWLAGFTCYQAGHHEMDEWERLHPPGSLRRATFLECITANPHLKDEFWDEYDVELRASIFGRGI